MKDRQIDTTIDGFRHVGINLTKEQYDDLCTLNMLILGCEHRKRIPIFNTMIVLKILGLLPAEMLCEPGCGHPVKSEEFSEELCQQKFGRFRFKD